MRGAALVLALALAAGAGTAQVPTDPPPQPSPGEAAPPPPDAAPADPPAEATERVVAALSRNRVSITTTFAGSEIFVFGAISRTAAPHPGDMDVIVAVSGPSEPIAVRRKARALGIWTNLDTVIVDAAPSFYAVAATGPLTEILSHTDDLRYRIGIDHQVRLVGAPAQVDDPEGFRRAVIRLRRDAGLYYEAPVEVEVKDRTLFTVSLALPANLVEGDYSARVFLLLDGRVADVFETSILVRREGLERWLFSLSRDEPLLYGILAVLIALSAGWAASEAFRLMRRR